ncbi:hypothetical protein Agub_g15544, partial [Astrephomene gubernaculifera]
MLEECARLQSAALSPTARAALPCKPALKRQGRRSIWPPAITRWSPLALDAAVSRFQRRSRGMAVAAIPSDEQLLRSMMDDPGISDDRGDGTAAASTAAPSRARSRATGGGSPAPAAAAPAATAPARRRHVVRQRARTPGAGVGARPAPPEGPAGVASPAAAADAGSSGGARGPSGCCLRDELLLLPAEVLKAMLEERWSGGQD